MDTKLLQKFEGCLIGAAIGDALGAPTEFMSVEAIRRSWGFLDDLVDWGRHKAGEWTDDTEMMIALAKGLLASPDLTDREATMAEVAKAFGDWYMDHDPGRAPGGTCLGGAASLRRGVPWREAGQKAGPGTGEGCGSPMRCHPVGLVYADRPEDLEFMAHSQGFATHQGPQTNNASVCQCFLIARLLKGDSMDEALSALMESRLPTQKMAKMIYEARDLHNDLDELLDRWRGWVGDEAFAAALACAVRFSTYAEAVTHAINSPGDSDSLGCICGALMGAKVGLAGIPVEWVAKVEARDELDELALGLYRRYEDLQGRNG